MMLTAPPRLDEAGVERLLARAAGEDAGRARGIDLSGVEFVDPFGLVWLLALGRAAAFRSGLAWGLVLPRSENVRFYLGRTGAGTELARLFILDRGEAIEAPAAGHPPERTLLEVTPIRESTDIHRAVARVKGRADRLLVGRLSLNPLAADRFTVALAEICQNIVDHSRTSGYVAAQGYGPGRHGEPPTLRLAVADAGCGIRESLGPRYAAAHEGEWDDRAAVRLAFRRGVTRFDDRGRGLGLKLVAEMVRGWGGRLLLRSGAAAFAIAGPRGPRPRRGPLPFFPGTQISIVLPAGGE